MRSRAAGYLDRACGFAVQGQKAGEVGVGGRGWVLGEMQVNGRQLTHSAVATAGADWKGQGARTHIHLWANYLIGKTAGSSRGEGGITRYDAGMYPL